MSVEEAKKALDNAIKEELYQKFRKNWWDTGSRVQATRSAARVWMWNFERDHGREIGDEFMARLEKEEGVQNETMD